MKYLQLQLTNPCSEQWDDMQQAGAGRYCDRCEKNIIDLTSKSDAELIRFFKNKEENVCGRLLSSQLDRVLVQPVSKMNLHWLMPLALGAIAFTPALAQELRPVMVHSDQTPASNSASFEPAVKLPVLKDTISGKVIDDMTGKPLKGVKVRKKGFENVMAITDSTGRFELDIPDGNMTIPYVFGMNGYSIIETSINDDMVVKLAAVPIIRIGGIKFASVDKKPLYVISAGEKSCILDDSKMKNISPDWIEKIDILKDAKATAIYGSKAANGVVLIEIKKAYAKRFNFSKKK